MEPQSFVQAVDSDSSGGTLGSDRHRRDRHHSGGGGGIKLNTSEKKAGTGKIVSPPSGGGGRGGGIAQQSKSGSRFPENFLVSLTGRIESGQLFGINDIYCKYNFSYGSDWQITAGLEEGISQITTKDLEGKFVWNFPIEVTFKSSNPHGWPQLVVSLYGSDFLGNHVARGYGSTFIPICQGCSTKTIHLFVPESSSFIQKISSWIVGRRPEFIDPKIVAQSEGRQVVRVNSCGSVTVKFEVILKDFRKLGFLSSSSHSEDFSM